MLVVLAGILIILIKATATHKEYTSVSEACPTGDVSENECIECVCSKERVFECRSKPCKVTTHQKTLQTPSCRPKVLYIHNYTVCLCNDDGTWPHLNCINIFKTFQVAQRCHPNTYVINDCNVCRCGNDGILDKKHCTTNVCPKNIVTRRIIQKQVYGSCESKNWYSLAPCQFCYCVSENKLICNTGNNYAKKLQLGSYNLNVCGKDLMKDALSLMPKEEKDLRNGSRYIQYNTEAPLKYNKNKLKYLNEGQQYHENNQNTKVNPVKIDIKLNESDEYYSESDEEMTLGPLPIIKESPTTIVPYKKKEKEKNAVRGFPFEGQHQMEPDPMLSETESKDHMNHDDWTDHPEKEQIRDPMSLGDVLRPYLPMVLDKVFQLALRKSMVSVDANSKCVPGTTTTSKCNACFCLKNNKLLCTDRDCK